MACIAVVGAANIDIGGFPNGDALMGDSNPGSVRMSAGGVGFNIARNIAGMGINVEMITALGGDERAEMLRAESRRSGVSLRAAPVFPDERTSAYLFIADAQGDMRLAVNDMRIHDRMTPALMADRLELLERTDAVVLDANLPRETALYLARRLSVPVFADAVSAAKAERLLPCLPYLEGLKPNRLEAERLTGLSSEHPDFPERAVSALLGRGVKQVYLTLGAEGVCCGDNSGILRLRGTPRSLTNATGAGDAFTAALLWARVNGLSLRESAIAGMAAASIAMACYETVDPHLSEALLLRRMAEIQKETEG